MLEGKLTINEKYLDDWKSLRELLFLYSDNLNLKKDTWQWLVQKAENTYVSYIAIAIIKLICLRVIRLWLGITIQALMIMPKVRPDIVHSYWPVTFRCYCFWNSSRFIESCSFLSIDKSRSTKTSTQRWAVEYQNKYIEYDEINVFIVFTLYKEKQF